MTSQLSVQDQCKLAAATAALDYIPEGCILGVGTGSTVNFLIDLLPHKKLAGAVASSKATADKLTALGIPVLDLNDVDDIEVYVDGADEIDDQLHMIKGGGAALTREKIVADVATTFVCMVDQSKCVKQLGQAFPLPVEVIPMARRNVTRQLAWLDSTPVWREGVVTDNGNLIIDVKGLAINDTIKMEQTINNMVGVVCNGLFAMRPADIALIASVDGVKVLERDIS